MAQTPLSRQAQPGDFLLVIRTSLPLPHDSTLNR